MRRRSHSQHNDPADTSMNDNEKLSPEQLLGVGIGFTRFELNEARRQKVRQVERILTADERTKFEAEIDAAYFELRSRAA